MTEIWANSADSHVLEPDDLWLQALPKSLAERAPRSERGDRFEVLYIDGGQVSRQLNDMMDAIRPPGARDLSVRLADLDKEGVWGQLAFPSMGFWSVLIQDRELAREVVRTWNDWAHSEIMGKTDRILTPACLSMANIDDAVAEVERVAELGFQAVFLPTQTREGEEYGLDRWEPVWTAAERAGLVLAFHIGTGGDTVVYRGPGGAVVNFVETTYPGMRVVSHMVAGGALDRHPGLKVLIAEGGASWLPAIADRMDEAYRQHGIFVRPKLSRLPSEIIREQVYASFQHDASAVDIVRSTGYRNVMWGDDYPHLEGTYGHTQETLRGLFEGVPDDIRDRITHGAFNELFTVPERVAP
ncbi:amidohydrolase [Yinghuangia sp. ASG 101]|uniref:amidohydrolase family protein n=1 Tax=Yinghuangia sp. ASG 101 TaxID=2896848 RepID=UPI001E4379D9|nr:amidohydrolase family protein [Yinghuangia sp. ASG 101]UGQ11239.1 amidohydrolase [Yinghuangia sp. ASG 101]